jgi:PilZ domain
MRSPNVTSLEEFCVSKIVSMPDRNANASIRVPGVRDRRYTIRYPFAADVELIDLETGRQVSGVTSDISLGGCFVCTSKPLSVNARARMKLTRKGEVLEALVVVRIVKPRVGMGIEFFDLEASNSERLVAWTDALSHSR